MKLRLEKRGFKRKKSVILYVFQNKIRIKEEKEIMSLFPAYSNDKNVESTSCDNAGNYIFDQCLHVKIIMN